MIVRKQYVQGLILLEAKNNHGKKVLKYNKLLEIEKAVYENLKGVFGDIIIDESYYTDKVYDLENKNQVNEKDCVAKLAVDEEKFKEIHEKSNPSSYIFSAVITETQNLIGKPAKQVDKKFRAHL